MCIPVLHSYMCTDTCANKNVYVHVFYLYIYICIDIYINMDIVIDRCMDNKHMATGRNLGHSGCKNNLSMRQDLRRYVCWCFATHILYYAPGSALECFCGKTHTYTYTYAYSYNIRAKSYKNNLRQVLRPYVYRDVCHPLLVMRQVLRRYVYCIFVDVAHWITQLLSFLFTEVWAWGHIEAGTW